MTAKDYEVKKRLIEAIQFALVTYDHITTLGFQRGEDKDARERLQSAIDFAVQDHD